MKDKQLQTKRQTKKGFRKLHAKVTSPRRRKQRVSAAGSADMLDSEVPNASIGRALTVILLLHVVAIGAIYLGIQWNKGRTEVSVTSGSPAGENAAVDIMNVNANLESDIVLAGDTYEVFAARHEVDVAELRSVNNNATIHAGKVLYLPPNKIRAAQAVASAELAVLDRPPLPTSTNVVTVQTPSEPVLVKAQTESAAPKAVVVEESSSKAKAVVVAAGSTYKVQPGDSVWRISNKYKVSQDALMRLNGMSNPRELRSGMTLKIPAN
ncbi:LysM peptidoglycan-binding domain-containing protein [Rubritalea spongiae]|uniref:LysM peptidoglycan-binding domain-containing protein n=1 Tax=Rubritalea spongiae TaxID=430797 RepID=A0ABW5EA09_9BACT